MLRHKNLIGIALATLLVAFVATSTPADDRKSNVHKNGKGSSTGLLVAGTAHDFGAAFSRDRDRCEKDDDGDKGRGGVRRNKGKHRPPCEPDDDDDDDDDDDCDGGGHGHGKRHGKGKKPKDCRPSPSR